MGGKEKDKDKKDKDKDKKDKDKDKKDKDKDKKDKDKDKKVKDKDKKDKSDDILTESWKLKVSKNLDNLVIAYEMIMNKFKDIDNYILKDATTRADFIDKVKNNIKDLSEPTQQIFLAFLNVLP